MKATGAAISSALTLVVGCVVIVVLLILAAVIEIVSGNAGRRPPGADELNEMHAARRGGRS